MISSTQFQDAYSVLYSCMRDYIWNLSTVEKLADVEVDIFDAFIDYDKLSKHFNILKPDVVAIAKDEEDQELLDAVDAMQQLIDQSLEPDAQSYYELYKVQETIDDDGKEPLI